ncbi:VCBS repeat-containing protein [uncultured Arcticibacterium sp.]|uniref:VCBS repeat-containing protein n=1 Tax=uncultured Arcticibacterium sp. TaxID=2173042 RepID=UPI0030FB6A60
MKRLLLILSSLCLLIACNKENKSPNFRLLEAERTGLNFENTLIPSPDLNIFSYLYFYNGGGVGAGDLNNDGLIDLVFTSNLGENKIFKNTGNLKFEDITKQANFTSNGGWSNGVSIVDINNDGLLDIYVSQVGNYDKLQGVNQLFVCKKIEDGHPVYKEAAAEYGLAIKSLATQAAFVDFDLDGDLDFYLLNHSAHRNGTFGARKNFLNTFHPDAGDRYFENQDGFYIDKTKESGIHSNALGYGLGIAAGDINMDGLPDLYIGNDFHENDYLYINNGNGTFNDETESQMPHTSRFSMGVDIADINNDLFPEIVSLDMLPYDYKLIKMADGEDVFYNFNFKLDQGYNFQFSRNALQLNNRNGSFSEIAMFSGVHATDWSWSSLLFDFDNDGLKDLFISNGINKRMNDTDYMNYVSNDAIQERINKNDFNESDELLTDLLPEVKIPNKFFKNGGDLNYLDLTSSIENNISSFSNGAIYADLDNDGDLDVVTNNINEKAFLYENLNTANQHIKINLEGSPKNRNAIGAKALLYLSGNVQYQEKFPVRGFQSSSETSLLFGIPSDQKIDSLCIIWPNNTFQTLFSVQDSLIELSYQDGLPKFDYEKLKPEESEISFEDVAASLGLKITHKENRFNEFDREALIPAMNSTPGPAIAVADINNDGLEDIFIGSSKWEKDKIFLQNTSGFFTQMEQQELQKDSTYEASSAQWADINGDRYPDLLVADGGNEYSGKTPFLKPRIYLNNGKGVLTKKENALPQIFETQACLKTADFDQDGDIDIFIGGKTISWGYGQTPNSYLLLNDGSGSFIDKTPEPLKTIGMVRDANWLDIDQDGDQDLILAIQWDGIYCFENEKGVFSKRELSDKKGWWNMLYPTDIDEDGDIDFIVGNLGENSRIKASDNEPVRMYVNDYDDNGRPDQIITHYMNGKEGLFADKKELEKQMPFIRKKYNLSRDFANAHFADILGKEKIKNAKTFEANYFSNAVLVNNGNWNFELKKLPTTSQLAPMAAASKIDNKNYLLMGNFYDANIQLGRYDADFGGTIHLKNDTTITHSSLNNLKIKGQVRSITPIKVKGRTNYIVARNNDELIVLRKIKR